MYYWEQMGEVILSFVILIGMHIRFECMFFFLTGNPGNYFT